MILYIAEKPSLGRAIADCLPKPHKKGDGCIYAGNGDCVSWCIGHLLEQAEPHVYQQEFKSWKFEHLPIVPEQWQLQPKSSARKQLAVLRKLVKEADTLVHAGDPDREGQLLVDQVIEHLKVRGAKRESIQRLLISDLNPAAVTRALGQLRSNKEFVPLSVSALARSRADWLYGINMTRAYTLQGRKVGYNGVLSVGRVQTPILGLVAQRDKDIEAFNSKPFYQVVAHCLVSESNPGSVGQPAQEFKALWQPSEACEAWMDEDGRILSKALADNVVGRITGKPAMVTATHKKPGKQPPPLPYNLSSLQIDAAKRFRMSAKQVLDVCQSLYEKHKLLTYPRSDCRYLPEDHYAQRQSVLAAIRSNAHTPELINGAANVDAKLKSKAWNDSKVSAHHAIVPTAKTLDLSRLSKDEQNIYAQVARQYLAQFYPACERVDTRIELSIGGGHFVAKSKTVTKIGWQALFINANKQRTKNDEKLKDAALNSALPKVIKGQQLLCREGELLQKNTSPPKPFDDASLLAAMTGIARFVQDTELRKVLKDTDGLGTKATRAGIIELLFKRDFLTRSGKVINATATGRGLIDSLPAASTSPDMTARWEMQLDFISRRMSNYQDFMQPLQATLRALIASSESHLPVGLKNNSNSNPFKKKRARSSSGNGYKPTVTKKRSGRRMNKTKSSA